MIDVIVPVFNCENYLQKCIDSILTNTFTHFSLILVDDGSTDKSGFICDEYSKKDDRITVIHQKNGGQSIARQTGLDYALKNSSNKYLCFIDGDDYVDERFLEKMFYAISNSDISICLYWQDDEGKIKSGGGSIKKTKPIKSDKYWKLKLGDAGAAALWNKLFKKQLFYGFVFPKRKVIEDEFAVYRLILKAKYISVINDRLYFYRWRQNSVSHSNRHVVFADNRMDLFTEQLQYICIYKCPKIFCSRVINSFCYHSSWYLNLGYEQLIGERMKQCEEIIKKIPVHRTSIRTYLRYLLFRKNNKKYYILIQKILKIKKAIKI